MIRTCAPGTRTLVAHEVNVPRCCPFSGNPVSGTFRLAYRPSAGIVLPVEDLAAMVEGYVGGRGAIRGMEEMIQEIAQRCADSVRVPIRAHADLRIVPPFGGDLQRLLVRVRCAPEVIHA